MTAKSVSFNPRMNSSPGSPLSATNNITYTTLRWAAAWGNQVFIWAHYYTKQNWISVSKKKEVE